MAGRRRELKMRQAGEGVAGRRQVGLHHARLAEARHAEGPRTRTMGRVSVVFHRRCAPAAEAQQPTAGAAACR